MKKFIILFALIILSGSLLSQETKSIQLKNPDLSRGFPVMKAFSLRSSASAFDTTNLSIKDLSDLLWAANGINRPENGKRTAPSAMNAQDIDVYVCMKPGIYFYDAKKQVLDLVAAGDHRKLVADRQDNFSSAPVFLILVSDISRFQHGEDSQKLNWAAEDAGIVSENIGLFCAGTGMLTRPRATMDVAKLKEIMKLKDTQHPILNNPVSYNKTK